MPHTSCTWRLRYQDRRLFDNANLEIERGERVALIGALTCLYQNPRRRMKRLPCLLLTLSRRMLTTISLLATCCY